MADALADVFQQQFGLLDVEVWAEPFAGGAGAGLHLLDRGVVDEVWLTERNPALAAFWRTTTTNSDELAARVRTCQPDMSTWHAAREIVAEARTGAEIADLDLAFAALLINRCSRSGMVNPSVGPIGGKNQNGRWHLRSRWNPEGLSERIDSIGRLGNRIRVSEGDAITHIAELNGSVGIEHELLLFVDPPYLVQGNKLYHDGMTFDDHKNLAEALPTAQLAGCSPTTATNASSASIRAIASWPTRSPTPLTRPASKRNTRSYPTISRSATTKTYSPRAHPDGSSTSPRTTSPPREEGNPHVNTHRRPRMD
ncbi:hypothetical protein LT337_32275 (plasmid) [Mycolicibacterium fortuitum]|nr:hypothetical protein LT337_32275 [Mycolicibacterium fortuitum]